MEQKLRSLLGSGASQIYLSMDPTERNHTITGNVLTTVTSPQYVITYGFK